VPPLDQDRALTGDIEAVATFLRSGQLHAKAEGARLW
jgi:histidine ammonia-lyase